MNKLHLTLFSVGTLLLTACGGGGGDSSPTVSSGSTGTSSTTPTTTPPATSQPDPVEDGAGALIVDADFTLSVDVTVSLDINPVVEAGSYLTVCSYDQQYNRVNRQACLYRGPIGDDGVQADVVLAHMDTVLVAEVWLAVENYQPTQYEWAYEPSRNEQVFVVR